MLTAAAADLAPSPDQTEASDMKRQEILRAVLHVFAAKGFERASMQDLARGAGMSVGNFYRYFPSKAAMIDALVQRQIEASRQHFARITEAEDPLAALREALHAKIEAGPCLPPEERLIWAEISVAALRNPAFAEVLDRLDHHITDYLIAAMALAAELPPEAARARFEPQAGMALLLLRCGLFDLPRGTGSSLMKSQIMRQLDLLLDEVGAARPKDVSA